MTDSIYMKNNIYIIGYMGTGKSTVSRILGDMLGVPVLEADDMIAARRGMSIKDIFAAFGEKSFRETETEILRDAAKKDACILSCGGGMPLSPVNREIMKKSGTVILLCASPETVYERVCPDAERPLLLGNMNTEYIADMMEKRRAAYEAAADFSVQTDGKDPGEVARECCSLINRMVK